MCFYCCAIMHHRIWKGELFFMAQQESQPYDRALKSLFGDEAAEILPRLVEGVELIGEQNIEIDRSTLRADLVYNVMYKGNPHIINMELQTGLDKDMPLRMLAYHVGLHVKFRLPVISVVLYPFETVVPESPYLEISDGEEILTFHYKVVLLSKLDAIQFVKDGVIAMYSLLPAMRNISVPLLVRVIKEMEQRYSRDSFIRHLTRFKVILNRSTTLTKQEKQEMNDELSSYDSLLESDPSIQEKVAKSKATGKAEGAQEMVTTLVEVRFPQLVEVAQQKVTSIQSVEMLAQLIKQIATVEDEKTALWVLNSYAA